MGLLQAAADPAAADGRHGVADRSGAILPPGLRGLSPHQRNAGLEDAADHGDRRYPDPDTYLLGYPGMAGNASVEWPGLVALLRIHRQYSVRGSYPAILEMGAWDLCLFVGLSAGAIYGLGPAGGPDRRLVAERHAAVYRVHAAALSVFRRGAAVPGGEADPYQG